MRNNSSNTLIMYSQMAGMFLLVNKEASSTVIVTDIDPDTIINVDGEFFLLDIDNNLTSDFTIFKDSGIYSYEGYSSTTIRFRHFIGAGPQDTFENKLLAGHYYNSWNGAEYYQPYDLSAGELIGPEGQFYNNAVQVICAGHFEHFYTSPGFQFGPGYWKDLDFEGVDNRYLGVSFVDADENRYYGWVRCSTADTMKAITIHEFAYENVPNTPIVAGDTVSYVGTLEQNGEAKIKIWSFGSTVYYYNAYNKDKNIKIIDGYGAIIQIAKLSIGSGSINLSNQSNGVYYVIIEGSKNGVKIIL